MGTEWIQRDSDATVSCNFSCKNRFLVVKINGPSSCCFKPQTLNGSHLRLVFLIKYCSLTVKNISDNVTYYFLPVVTNLS